MNVHLTDPFDAADDGGLERDPFGDRYDAAAYFDEAVRAKRLNLLFHLVPYSDVLLVTGEPGSGKTSLLQRLLQGANDNWRMCQFRASPDIDAARLLEILHKEFSLRPDGSSDDEQRLRLLRESLYSLRHNALIPVLIIDDAHRLTQSALAMLATLTEPWQSTDRLLSVVLFGEPEISKRLVAPGLEALRGRVGHTFDIPPLSEEDTGRYILHRLQAAGLKGSGPFTESVVRFIHVASRGFPGRINEFARVVLHNQEEKGTRAQSASPAAVGRGVYLKYGIAAVLVSLAAVGLLYQDRLAVLVRDFRATGPSAQSVEPPTAASPTAGTTPESLMSQDSAVGEVLENEPAAIEPDGPEAATVADAGGDSAPSDAETVPAPDEGEDTGGTPPPVAGATASDEIESVAEPAAVRETVASSPPPVARADAGSPSESSAPSTPGGPRDEAWLLEQDPTAYTVQLLVASQEQCLAYIERHGLGDAAAIYQTRSSGQVWSSLVYGAFASNQDAADAAKAISEQDVKASPWVRRLGVVQDRIRAFRATATPVSAAAPAPASVSTPTPAPRADIKGMPAPGGGTQGEDWLLAQPPDAYTLQLFTGKEANVKAYLKRHALQDRVALYQPRGDGEGRLTVTYGVYADRAEAARASAELGARLPDLKPWVRPLRDIQSAISGPRAVTAPAP
ncbi:MAG: AAA family ATPase [Gammaproteobacteria bacterium]|nr:AAA family ATPase [Gammaproteobacteria bacterium]